MDEQRRKNRVAATALVAVCFLVGSVLGKSDTAVKRNAVYGMYSGLALLMDVYTPAEPNGFGLIMIPGSGWEAPLGYGADQLKQSYEVDMILGIDAFNDAGYTVFVINHRSTPRFKYPAPVEDVQRAVRYVRHHASDFGIDSDRIGAVGGSSGGHLVSLLGTMDGSGNESDPDPVNRQSAKVQAVIAVYPAVDFLAFETSNPWAGGAITSLLGPVNPAWKPPPLHDPEAAAIYEQASPLSYLSPDDPPFLLIHGDADSVVPFSQSERFRAKLQQVGVEVKLIRIPGGNHGPVLIQEGGPDYITEAVDWADQHLKN